MIKTRFILLGLGAAVVSCFFVARTQADNQLYISQVQILGNSSTDDFVELFNPNSSSVSLNGYILAKRTSKTASDNLMYSWSGDTFVAPYSFYLWANGNFAGIAAAPDAVSTSSIAGDSSVVLRQGAPDVGAIIDSLSWGTTSNGLPSSSYGNPGANKSLQRQDLFSAASGFGFAASNPRNSLSAAIAPPSNAAQNQTASAASDGSSGQQAAATSTKSNLIKIYRFLPNPAGDDTGNEWVELINNDSQDTDVSGWILDDKNTGSGPAADAYVLSGVIAAGAVQRFVLPAAAFALNNSGGDEVNLYFADKTLADSAVYTAAAYDDGIFSFSDGAWQPPAQATSGGGGGGGGSASTTTAPLPVAATSTSSSAVGISEFLPNPFGDDAGNEWVELYNSGSATTSLAGWKLDDSGTAAAPGASAYALDKTFSIGPKSFLVVSIPADRFVLGNSGSDAARLFDANGALVQNVVYSNAPEGQSFAADSFGKWSFGAPTPGFSGSSAAPPALIIISEVLPNPAGDGDEFLELENISTDTPVNLAGFKLQIGSREKIFDDELVATGSYLTLYEDDLPAKLRNSGQKIFLLDSFGRTVSSVTYDKAAPGQAYAVSDAGVWGWTDLPTPGARNQMVLAAATGEQPANLTPPLKTSAAKNSASAAEVNKLLAENQILSGRVTALEASVSQMQLALAGQNPATQAADESAATSYAAETAKHPPAVWYLLGSAAGLIVLIALIKKYL